MAYAGGTSGSDNTKTSGGFVGKPVGKDNRKSGGDTKKEQARPLGIDHSGRTGDSPRDNK